MGPDYWKDIFSIGQSAATILALVVGGLWAYSKFIYRREKEPRAEVDLDLNFVGIQDSRRLVEVSVYIENKGEVRHPVENLRVALLYLSKGEKVIDGDADIKYQVKFPHSISQELWRETYIDSHLRYRNSYITAIPVEATFVLVRAKFTYKGEPYPSQKLFKVPWESTEVVLPKSTTNAR